MSKEVSTITLRMTPEEKFEIEKAAAKSKRSVNKFIIYRFTIIIIEHIEKK